MALAPQKMFDTATNPNDVGTTAGYIGINNNDPQSELDIIGNIRASDEFGNPDKQGEAHASEYCDTAGNNCFKAESIAGNDPNMNCIGSKGMSGIGSNKAKCSEIIPSFTTATTAPQGSMYQEFHRQE